MFKQFFMVMIASSLVACGSDSSDNTTHGIESDINSELKGSSEAPQLSTINGELSDGSTIPLNTILNTSISAFSTIQFSYTAPEDQTLAIILDGEDINDSDLDLAIKDFQNSRLYTSTSFDADEAIVFQAEMGESYIIEIDSVNGFETNYSLTLVTANRSSLELNNDEYVVELRHIETEVCSSNTDNSQSTETSESIEISAINFKQGYARSLFDTNKFTAEASSGNTLFFSHSYEEYLDDVSVSVQGSSKSQLTVNPDNGVLTGSVTRSSSESKANGEIESCTSDTSTTGNILL